MDLGRIQVCQHVESIIPRLTVLMIFCGMTATCSSMFCFVGEKSVWSVAHDDDHDDIITVNNATVEKRYDF